jgi:hypothetical protein
MSVLDPVSGIARKSRSDKGVIRKSTLDTFCDLFRRMSPSEQATALEVLRQLQRLGHAGHEKEDDSPDAAAARIQP